MKYIKLSHDNEENTIIKTKEVIANGGIAILPTDTVYGIVSDCLNEEAVKRIYNLKNRDFSKPCNILVSNIDMIRKVTKEVSKKEEHIINKFFPRSTNNNI